MTDGKDVLGMAKSHFREKLDASPECIDVPEWGMKIYFKPINLKQQDKIYKYIRAGSLESLAETVIVRALDENGNKIFKPVHKTELMTLVDSDVISRICEVMGGEDPEEAGTEAAGDNAKNS